MISNKLNNPNVWAEFLAYKQEKKHLLPSEEQDLTDFIEKKEYLPVVERMLTGCFCAIPEKKLIRKMQTSKKRIVYLFPREENYVYKLLTFLLIRKYDSVFADNLYSFRLHFGVKRAVSTLINTENLSQKYSYKVDISNYFNSIPPQAILSQLRELLSEDDALFSIFEHYLSETKVLDRQNLIEESKGVMAGTPPAVFLANLYLTDLDEHFASLRIPYARYSDDILFFADTRPELEAGISYIKKTLAKKGLCINPAKEIITSPGEAWSFLGISYCNRIIDVSPISLQKIKDKIRRKARAIKRWQIRKGATDMQAVRAFIRSMNHKFFDAVDDHDMTWTRWYFPLINTDTSLHEIDLYLQYWIRYLSTGKHTLKNYNLRYEVLKENGYISLVHAFYEYKEKQPADNV